MRLRMFLPALSLVAMLLVSCGQPTIADQSVANVITTTTTEAETSVPATSTPTPTLTPTETVTPTETAAPTEVPTSLPTPTTVPTLSPEAAAADVNDVPQLIEQTASESGSIPVAAVTPAQPVRLTIPAINLDYKPVSVGLDKNRVPVVPNHDVGWYNLSAMPGQGENIVFWGHVLRFRSAPNIAAPFARVKELKTGDLIVLTTAQGEQARYKVTKVVQVTPDQVKYILPTGKEQVTLVSCIGDNVIANGEVTKKYRLVTIAEPTT